MARTKGARDAKPRRKAARKPTAGTDAKKARPAKSDTAGRPAEQPAGGTHADLAAAIEAQLGHSAGQSQRPAGGTDGPVSTGAGTPTPAVSDPLLGLDGWRQLLMTPFRLLNLYFGVGAIEQLGEQRTPELARVSYPLYEHAYSTWLGSDPNDPLAVAKAATVALTVGLALETALTLQAALAARRQADGAPVETPAKPAAARPAGKAWPYKDV